MNPRSQPASLVFSLAGLECLKQGRNEGDVTRMVCGVPLPVYSCMVPGALPVVAVGALLTVAPFVLKSSECRPI